MERSEDDVRAELASMQRIARQAAPSDCDADDAVQEAFLTILTKPAARGRDPRRYRRAIVRNQLRRFWSARARRKEIESQGLQPAAVLAPVDESIQMEWSRIVRTEIDQLEEPYRSALNLHLLEGRTYAEIARITGAKEVTVRSWISRGRSMLTTRLKRYGIESSTIAVLLAHADVGELGDGVRSAFQQSSTRGTPLKSAVALLPWAALALLPLAVVVTVHALVANSSTSVVGPESPRIQRQDGSSLTTEPVSLGGRAPLAPRQLRSGDMPAGTVGGADAQSLPSFEIQAVDKDSRASLEDVEIIAVDYPSHDHPGVDTVTYAGVSGLKSPVNVLPQLDEDLSGVRRYVISDSAGRTLELSPGETDAGSPRHQTAKEAAFFVRSKNYGWKSLSVDLRSGGERPVYLEPGADLTVTLANYDPSLYAKYGSRFWLRLHTAEKDDLVLESALTGEIAEPIRVTGLNPRRYRVVGALTFPGGQEGGFVLATDTIELGPGESAAVLMALALPPLPYGKGIVGGSLLLPPSAQHRDVVLGLHPLEAARGSPHEVKIPIKQMSASPAGGFEWQADPVPSGRYFVSVAPFGFLSEVFEVAAGTSSYQSIEIPELAEVRVQLTDSRSGALARDGTVRLSWWPAPQTADQSIEVLRKSGGRAEPFANGLRFFTVPGRVRLDTGPRRPIGEEDRIQVVAQGINECVIELGPSYAFELVFEEEGTRIPPYEIVTDGKIRERLRIKRGGERVRFRWQDNRGSKMVFGVADAGYYRISLDPIETETYRTPEEFSEWVQLVADSQATVVVPLERR